MGGNSGVSIKDANSTMLEWDTRTPHAYKFAFGGNFICKVDGKGHHQLIALLPKGIAIIKATIKKYGGLNSIAFGLLTENRKDEDCSVLILWHHQNYLSFKLDCLQSSSMHL